MRREAHKRLFALILMLTLCGSGTMTATRVVQAGTLPGEPVPGTPPSDPQAGDPDSPGGKTPKPGPGSGTIGAAHRDVWSQRLSPRQGSFGLWMLRFRTAFASVIRILFRV